MKIFISAFLLISVMFIGCSDQDSMPTPDASNTLVASSVSPASTESDIVDKTCSTYGIITGYDFRKCACCGGWFVNINQRTFRFLVPPSNTTLDLTNPKVTFPLAVKLNFKRDPNACLGDEILVSCLQKL